MGHNENTPSTGTTVDGILTGASWADVDTGALKGIAITAASGNGTWQYSTDGLAWTAFGPVSGSSALLLDATTQVRYVPDGSNAESAGFSFVAWDRTSGSASIKGSPSTADPGPGGGTTSTSSQRAGTILAVTSVNDAPVLDNTGAMTMTTIGEDDASNRFQIQSFRHRLAPGSDQQMTALDRLLLAIGGNRDSDPAAGFFDAGNFHAGAPRCRRRSTKRHSCCRPPTSSKFCAVSCSAAPTCSTCCRGSLD